MLRMSRGMPGKADQRFAGLFYQPATDLERSHRRLQALNLAAFRVGCLSTKRKARGISSSQP
jgi:hypothetical protein